MIGAFVLALLAQTQADCGLVLKLEPDPASGNSAHSVVISATLTNRGDRSLTLVMPGDGSLEGMRTPVLTWSADPSINMGGGRCGNINTLKRGEVFTLAVGESRVLPEWVRPQLFRAPPRFQATMTYWNDPQRPWGGIPLGEHDSSEMARVRASDACFVRSNTIDVIWEPDPANPPDK